MRSTGNKEEEEEKPGDPTNLVLVVGMQLHACFLAGFPFFGNRGGFISLVDDLRNEWKLVQRFAIVGCYDNLLWNGESIAVVEEQRNESAEFINEED
jgi:hypothetical protein